MKNYLIKAAAICIVLCSVFSLAACREEPPQMEGVPTTAEEKASISETVKIVNIPTDTAELTDMLNNAIGYVDRYCYKFNKNVKCEVETVNLGALSAVSNARNAFASIFGQKELASEYDYKADKKLFAENFIKGSISKDEITEIRAYEEDGAVVVVAELASETVTDGDEGLLCRLGGEHITPEDVKTSLTEFKSSATAVSVSADGIKLTAKISTEDSRLVSMDVEYTERFNLSGVKLVEIEGGTVSGNAKTEISYTNLG